MAIQDTKKEIDVLNGQIQNSIKNEVLNSQEIAIQEPALS